MFIVINSINLEYIGIKLQEKSVNKLYRQQPFVLMMNTVDSPTMLGTSLSTSLVHNLRIHLSFGK